MLNYIKIVCTIRQQFDNRIRIWDRRCTTQQTQHKGTKLDCKKKKCVLGELFFAWTHKNLGQIKVIQNQNKLCIKVQSRSILKPNIIHINQT
jgi:hypothetical protein